MMRMAFKTSLALMLGVVFSLDLLGLLVRPATVLQAAPAAELRVCPSVCAYLTVQAAVDAASTGDVIKVAAGTYTGVSARTDVTQAVYISKTITIQGGYITTNWMTPYPITQPTTLDAQGQGRVLYITGNISPTIAGLHITGGNAIGLDGRPPFGPGPDVGGGVYIYSATAIISNNWVFSNTSDLGGGVFLLNSASTLAGNTITSNTTEYEGGGVFLLSSAAILNGNTVSANKADAFGGGGLVLDQSSATLSNNTVALNSTNGDGGGLVLVNNAATLSGNTIVSNTASAAGGLYLQNSDAMLISNTIAANTATFGNGGGLFLEMGSDATLNENTIMRNTAGNIGGGLYLHFSDALVSGNTIVSNTAASFAGGVYVYASHGAMLGGNSITANTASSNGGGIFLDGSNATLSENIVAGNLANSNGGGLYVGSWVFFLPSNPTLINNSIIDNQASGLGSGLYIAGASPRLLHNTLARNRGGDGSGIHVTDLTVALLHSTASLTNTILVSHTVGITVSAGNTATLQGTLWGTGAWANGANWGGSGTILTGTVNLFGDPGFVNPLSSNYHITATSAAFNAGVNAGVVTDIDSEPRPHGAGFDIGADEYWPPGALKHIYLPLIRRPCSTGICGRVTDNGIAAVGVPLELRFYNGSVFLLLASTTTAANGSYSFTGVPSLGPGQLYFVRYLNPGTPGRLWLWATRRLTSYTAGSAVEIGNFDIADIALLSPADGVTVTLPQTFQWAPRPATPSDDYEFVLYEPTYGYPSFFPDPTLGYVGSYTLDSLPTDFSPNVPYAWEVWVYSPDGGFGISNEARLVTFSNAGVGVAAVEESTGLAKSCDLVSLFAHCDLVLAYTDRWWH